jgi:hypothetical protein
MIAHRQPSLTLSDVPLIDPSLYLQAPVSSLDDKKIEDFERLLESALGGRSAPVIEYGCPYPKHEFLSYLFERHGFLLHGSNRTDLEWIEPVRTTTGKAAWQTLGAVYACSDGIWPIFYAIVDRQNYTGSLRNECFRVTDAAGVTRKFYYFALNIQMLRKRVWTDGMIYVLPRDSFERLTDHAGNALEEWASRTSVRALARVVVAPEDFPFLDKVRVQREKEFAPARTSANQAAAVNHDAFVAQYELAPGFILTLTKVHDRLQIQAPGYPAVPLLAETETSYSLEGVPARITFNRNERGEVTDLILIMSGRELLARRRA